MDYFSALRRSGKILDAYFEQSRDPSLAEHYIEWIVLETEQGFQIHYLKPGMKPEAIFLTNEKVVAAYEYCNLHGLWKAEV